MNAPTMFKAAQRIGRAIRTIQNAEGKALAAADVDHDVAFLFGGQIKGGRLRLFMIYSAGNFIECTTDTPYLQIGEHKYGKPVLDRAISFDTDLYDALKIGLISMDSTMRSNLGVGLPIDILVARRDTCNAEVNYRIEPGEPYFQDLRERWSGGAARRPYGHPAPALSQPGLSSAPAATLWRVFYLRLTPPRELPHRLRRAAPHGGETKANSKLSTLGSAAKSPMGRTSLRGPDLAGSGRPRASEERPYTSWDRARLSVVVPIGVIVAVAIVCIVVAVLSSAQRADEVAIEHEKQLFSRALEQLRRARAARSRKRRLLGRRRSTTSASNSIRPGPSSASGFGCETYFDHDYVFIFDANDKPVYSLVGRAAGDADLVRRRLARHDGGASTTCAAASRPCAARSA